MRRCSASPGPKPRSAKTLPDERCILSAIATPPGTSAPVAAACTASGPGRSRHPASGASVSRRHEGRTLPRQLGHVQPVVLTGFVDADLDHTRTDGWHWLPVGREQAVLNLAERKAGSATGVRGSDGGCRSLRRVRSDARAPGVMPAYRSSPVGGHEPARSRSPPVWPLGGSLPRSSTGCRPPRSPGH